MYNTSNNKKEEPELSPGLVVAGLYRNEKPTSQKTDGPFCEREDIFLNRTEHNGSKITKTQETTETNDIQFRWKVCL